MTPSPWLALVLSAVGVGNSLLALYLLRRDKGREGLRAELGEIKEALAETDRRCIRLEERVGQLRDADVAAVARIEKLDGGMGTRLDLILRELQRMEPRP